MGTASVTCLIAAIFIVACQIQTSYGYGRNVYVVSPTGKNRWKTEIYKLQVPAAYKNHGEIYLQIAKESWDRTFGTRYSRGFSKEVFYEKIKEYEECVRENLRKLGFKPQNVAHPQDFISRLFDRKPRRIRAIKVPAAYSQYPREYIRYFRKSLEKVFGKHRCYKRQWYTHCNEIKFRKQLSAYLGDLVAQPCYKKPDCYCVSSYYYFDSVPRIGRCSHWGTHRWDYISSLFTRKPRQIKYIRVPRRYHKYSKFYIRSFRRALRKIYGQRKYFEKKVYTPWNEYKLRTYLAYYLRELNQYLWQKQFRTHYGHCYRHHF